MILGLALLLATLALRLTSANRHIRGRLTVTAFVFAAYLLLVWATQTQSLSLSADLREALAPLLPLLFAFGLINGAVALLVNPWRVDRLPDRFPNIVQDTIVIVLFAIVATLILQEKIFATTAVGAVVIGFALQDTLGNLFAGLAIQIEKPFKVGHWVRIADTDGLVSEITWRATKLRTKAGNFIIVPNSTLSKDTITNYSEPALETRIEVEVGASYDVAPNAVKSAILDAIHDEPLMTSAHPPEVLLVDFAASAMVYRVRVWSTDFAADERLRDRLRSTIYYAFKREGIAIPYPIQVEIPGAPAESFALTPAEIAHALRGVEIFSTLDDAALGALGRSARLRPYATGEAIVRQGQAGASMFVIVRGAVVVRLESAGQDVARLGPGDFFGEMSLLTGAPRNATVRPTTDSELIEVTADVFRSVVLSSAEAAASVGAAVTRRAEELERARTGDAPAASAEAPGTLVDRIRRFLRLPA